MATKSNNIFSFAVFETRSLDQLFKRGNFVQKNNLNELVILTLGKIRNLHLNFFHTTKMYSHFMYLCYV